MKEGNWSGYLCLACAEMIEEGDVARDNNGDIFHKECLRNEQQ